MVRSAAIQSALEANLAGLSRVNADVVQLLREVEPERDMRFVETEQGVAAGLRAGRQMCSRRKPLDEAQRLVGSVDLIEHAVVVVLGFGMGYHVQALAERMGKAGVIVVYEPDVALARAVLEQVDHSAWLNQCNLVWVTDAGDRAGLAGKLKGVESVLGQGVEIVEHPASRDRLGARSAEFSQTLRGFVDTTRTVLLTQMVRSADAVRNMVRNVEHYVRSGGIAELKDAARGFPAVVVSAGPSLRKNMKLLAEPGVRDRVVIVAVQTVLKPLLAAGIKPHFVTALDFHEISRRFYEGLTVEDVDGVTLVVEPKVHPAVLEAWPTGASVRCVRAEFLDELLGGDQNKGQLPAGTTVAHLAMYLAQHLGCTPIAMIGQDLGFSDGLYYGPGTAIDAVWAPELNAFNTIEMLQWQRIVRHRGHLRKMRDVHGRPIYTDAQMAAYLQQFERDFAAARAQGVAIIDATEGGVAKQHATAMPLKEVLRRYATRVHGLNDVQEMGGSEVELIAARKRITQMVGKIADLRNTAQRTRQLLQRMLADQEDQAKMQRHFGRLEQLQQRAGRQGEAFRLLEYLNQVGSFNRRKADRRLQLQQDLTPMQRQRLELERDAENVAWIDNTAEELIAQLKEVSAGLVKGQGAGMLSAAAQRAHGAHAKTARVAALVAIDPDRDGLGFERSLADVVPWAADGEMEAGKGARNVVQATLERLGESRVLERIILITPRGFYVEALIDRSRIGLPVEVEVVVGVSPFGQRQRAIAAARLFSDTAWRGGIGNMTVYDEVLCPEVMHGIMQKRGVDAALIAGPDWPLIDVTSETGCDALVQRYLENPDAHSVVFTQAPPGLCGCVISARLMEQLSAGHRLCTLGSVLGYQPRQPRADVLGTDAHMQIDHRVRGAMIRATYRGRVGSGAADAAKEIGQPWAQQGVRHLVLEICTERVSNGLFYKRLVKAAGQGRPRMGVGEVRRIFEGHAAGGECVLSLAGVGDPLLHPEFDAIVAAARESGMRAVHVRTDLLVDERREVLDRLLASGVDVVSVDLHADSPATYRVMMGVDRFGEVLENIQYLLEHRERLTDHPSTAALALPWLVMRMQRCAQTMDDLESFFDRWQHVLGTAVIEGVPQVGGHCLLDDGAEEWGGIEPAVTPQQAVEHAQATRTVILSDGTWCMKEMARVFLP